MSRLQHMVITKHIWRLIRALFITAATVVWLSIEGITGAEWVVLALVIGAAIVDQFKGFICVIVEKILHWKEDYKWYE